MSDDLVAPWDVFDLSNEDLQAQMDIIVTLAAASENKELPDDVIELKELLEREMKERSVSFDFLSRLATAGVPQQAADASKTTAETDKTPKSDETAHVSKERDTVELPPRPQSELAFDLPPPPPWYKPPTPATPASTAGETTTPPSKPPSPPPRRGLWDNSGSSSSSDESAATGNAKRASFVKLFNPNGYFGVSRATKQRRRKRKQKEEAPAPPPRKPAIPAEAKGKVRPKASTPQVGHRTEAGQEGAKLQRSNTPAATSSLGAVAKDEPKTLRPKMAFTNTTEKEQTSAKSEPKQKGTLMKEDGATTTNNEPSAVQMSAVIAPTTSSTSECSKIPELKDDEDELVAPLTEPAEERCRPSSKAGSETAKMSNSVGVVDVKKHQDTATESARHLSEIGSVVDEQRTQSELPLQQSFTTSVTEPAVQTPRQQRSTSRPQSAHTEARTEVRTDTPRTQKESTGDTGQLDDLETKPTTSCISDAAKSAAPSERISDETTPQRVPQATKQPLILRDEPQTPATTPPPAATDVTSPAPRSMKPRSASYLAPSDYTQWFTSIEDFLVEPTRLVSMRKQPAPVVKEALLKVKASLEEWFRVMAELEEQEEDTRPMEGELSSFGRDAMWYKVQKSRAEVYELATEVMDDRRHPRWEEADEGCLWNLWWTWRKPKPKEPIWLATQMVNHIPGSSQLTRKDLLKANIQRYRRTKSQLFQIMPRTFTLPAEYVTFAQTFAELGGLWIMKTVGMSRGRGIKLVSTIDDVSYTDTVVLQQYIDRPCLIDGFKFDFRLYVVVTHFSPLEAFISKRGFARISSMRYTTDADSLGNKSIHLTNTSVSSGAKKKESSGSAPQVQRTDTKWSLQRVREHFENSHDMDWSATWRNICDTIVRALACAEDNIKDTPCTFELFGFDIILDEHFKPYVLEVNASPAMDIDGPVDEDVKPSLFDEMFDLVDPLPIDKHALKDCVDEWLHPSAQRWSPSEKKAKLNKHLTSVLSGRLPRKYGEEPTQMGEFERLAPSALYDKVQRQKRSA